MTKRECLTQLCDRLNDAACALMYKGDNRVRDNFKIGGCVFGEMRVGLFVNNLYAVTVEPMLHKGKVHWYEVCVLETKGFAKYRDYFCSSESETTCAWDWHGIESEDEVVKRVIGLAQSCYDRTAKGW